MRNLDNTYNNAMECTQRGERNDLFEESQERSPEFQKNNTAFNEKIEDTIYYLQYIGADEQHIKIILDLADLKNEGDQLSIQAFIDMAANEPIIKETIKDGLKNKPAYYLQYFEELKKCGAIPYLSE